ncbi:MAG: hypothetical protein JXR19_11685, partial [Bacteroidia bacterium]
MMETGEPNVKVLRDHTDKIRNACFSPDGKYFVTVGYDQRAFLYDSLGVLIKELVHLDDQGYTGVGDIHTAAFSADGKVLVIGTRQLSGVNTMTYSVPDGNLLAEFKGNDNTVIACDIFGNRTVATAGGENRDIYLWDAYTGDELGHLVGAGRRVYKVASSSNGLLAISTQPKAPVGVNDYGELNVVLDLDRLELSAGDPDFTEFESEQLNYGNYYLQSAGAYRLACVDENREYDLIELDPGTDGRINCYSFTPNGDIAVGSNYDLSLFTKEGKLLRSFRGHHGDVYSLAFSENGKTMYSASGDQTVKLWNLNEEGQREMNFDEFMLDVRNDYGDETIDGLITDKGMIFFENLYFKSYPKLVFPKASLFVSDKQDWALWTDKNYYASSLYGGSMVGFHQNLHTDTLADFFTFEQYDLQWNRPDLVLDVLDLGSPELKEMYHLAYLKRLRKLGLKPEDFSGQIKAPEIEVKTANQRVDRSRFGFYHTMKDFEHGVEQEHVTINGVPVFGVNGLGIPGEAAAMQINTMHTELSPGMNKVQIWCSNTKGIHSKRETRYIFFDTVDVKPNLYILGIGASKYEDSSFDLKY